MALSVNAVALPGIYWELFWAACQSDLLKDAHSSISSRWGNEVAITLSLCLGRIPDISSILIYPVTPISNVFVLYLPFLLKTWEELARMRLVLGVVQESGEFL